MSHEIDLSFLDRPEILDYIFYPRGDFAPALADTIRSIEVAPQVKIACQFYLKDKSYPTVLYFHGNGETAGDYRDVAPLFNQREINLFVADYRGYGLSNGRPTISSLFKDAHPVFNGTKEIIRNENCKSSLFIMGRSLGSTPAIELAYHHQSEISGLIIESGGARSFFRLLNLFGTEVDDSMTAKLEAASNRVKIQSVTIPTLIIHGEYDSIIPVEQGIELYNSSGAKEKELLIIPRADHNDIWSVAGDKYYKKLGEFVKAHR